MTQNYKELFKEYHLITYEIDEISTYQSRLHSKHLQCKKGCDLCCMDYSIFPVEFYSILKRLKQNNFQLRPDKKKNSCIFLNEHACTIYENRPVICRTHGLPLLYMNDQNEWELSNCELNFTEFNFDDFDAENTFPMDKFNSKLFVLNKKFISEFQEEEYNESHLIPLKKIFNYL